MSDTLAIKRPEVKRKAKARPVEQAIPKVITDHGLDLRYRRGDVTVDHAAADPENPNRTVSRPRITPIVELMHKRGGLSREQVEAADRYLLLRETEGGASQGESVGGGKAPWDRSNASEAQMNAIQQLRVAHEAIGPHARQVLQYLVVDNMPVTWIGRQFGSLDRKTKKFVPADKRRVYGWVESALTRLVELWGLDPRAYVRGR